MLRASNLQHEREKLEASDDLKLSSKNKQPKYMLLLFLSLILLSLIYIVMLNFATGNNVTIKMESNNFRHSPEISVKNNDDIAEDLQLKENVLLHDILVVQKKDPFDEMIKEHDELSITRKEEKNPSPEIINNETNEEILPSSKNLFTIQSARDIDLQHLSFRQIFNEERRWPGVDFHKEKMVNFMETQIKPLKSEISSVYFDVNQFSIQDAQMLYSFIRSYKPAKVIEVGSGVSTISGTSAAVKNNQEGKACRYIVIDKYPTRIPKDLPGLCKDGCIIADWLETVKLDLFKELDRNDIFFIDSSHLVGRFRDSYVKDDIVFKDVAEEFLEILPRLKPGVIVHIHDIPFPNHAWFDTTKRGKYEFDKRNYIEQFVLHALLSHSTYSHSTYFEPVWFAGLFGTPWDGRSKFTSQEVTETLSKVRQVFDNGLADRLISVKDRVFGGGGSVWIKRTDESTKETDSISHLKDLTMKEVLDNHRNWFGVSLPPHENNNNNNNQSIKTNEEDDDKFICEYLRDNVKVMDYRYNEENFHVESVTSKERVEKICEVKLGSYKAQKDIGELKLSELNELDRNDVIVYKRGNNELKGVAGKGYDNFLIFTTEILTRVREGVKIVIFGITFPQHSNFDDSTRDTDASQFVLQALLMHNYRLRIAYISNNRMVINVV